MATVLLAVGTALPAWAETRTYADDFSSGGYSGSSGSTGWETSWVETGESNGPGSGSIQVRSHDVCEDDECLVIQPLVGTGLLAAQRRVPMTGVAAATVLWHIDFPGGLLVLGSAVVEASADGGSWQRLRSHGPGSEGSYSAGLPAATEYVDIRIRPSGLSVGAVFGFDSVVVEATMAATTTTTTTSTTTTSTTTTSSTTTTTRPGITIPPITIPPILTTTTSTTTSTTTTTTIPDEDDRSTTTTTTTDDRPRTTTTTTTRPSDEDEPDTPTTTTTAPAGDDTPGGAEPPPPPSETFGVVTRLDPGVGNIAVIDLAGQDRLLVRFLRATEDISFDILLNVALGILLAWASTTKMPRR